MNFQATQLPDSRCESCYINAYSVLTSAKIMAKSRTIKTRHIVRCCEGSRDDFTMAKDTSSCLPSKTRMNWTSPSKIKSAQEQACSILWRGQLPQLNLLSSLFLCHNHGLSHDHGKWTHDPTRILIPCIHLYIYIPVPHWKVPGGRIWPFRHQSLHLDWSAFNQHFLLRSPVAK